MKINEIKKCSSILLAGIAIVLIQGCASTLPQGPSLSRVEHWDQSPEFNEYDQRGMTSWINSETPVSMVHTPEDILPNGRATCMSPLIVNWTESNVSASEEGFIIVHDVQVGGNPLQGVSRHATIKIPMRGIERIEFVIVRYQLKGFAKYGGHVQLRFVFKEDRRPCLLGNNGLPDREHPLIDDLILSWEGWRAPLSAYNMKDGLDTDQGYALTARLYDAGQRFLNDSLRGAVWDCYPLLLPDDDDAEDYVLLSGLLLGDAVARRSMLKMIDDKLLTKGPDALEQQLDSDMFKKAMSRLEWNEIPDKLIKEEMKTTNVNYHMFKRSCITLTLTQIDLAMKRLYEKKNLGSRISVIPEPCDIPPFFDAAFEENTWGMIKGAPRALFWIMGHSELLPYKAYSPLQKGGVLQLDEKGKVKAYRYGHKENMPYGTLKRNLL